MEKELIHQNLELEKEETRCPQTNPQVFVTGKVGKGKGFIVLKSSLRR